ncbi:MAG: RMD1 family protein [Desulfobacterales bacterium]|nr:RMD1 family protein [Desulfobacterales bacterium]
MGEHGLGMLFRYGVAVLFNVTDAEQKAYLKELKGRIDKPYRRHESEDTQVLVSAKAEGISADGINLTEATLPRLQVVATALARSVSLAWYETAMAAAFDVVEPLARELDKARTSGRVLREVLRHIGGTLLTQQKMIGRVEIIDKPDILWDQPELERLYARLEDEYEAGRAAGGARPQARTHRAHRRDHPRPGARAPHPARGVVHRRPDRVRGGADACTKCGRTGIPEASCQMCWGERSEPRRLDIGLPPPGFPNGKPSTAPPTSIEACRSGLWPRLAVDRGQRPLHYVPQSAPSPHTAAADLTILVPAHLRR